MADAPSYKQEHFRDFVAAATYQQNLVSYIASFNDEGIQEQIDDLQEQIIENDTEILVINTALGKIFTGEYWTSPVSVNVSWNFQSLTATNITVDNFSSGNVTITGGVITDITDLAVADGGTGASTAADARTNLDAEQAFSKNTAFNKNFGTIAGTVLEGDTTAADLGIVQATESIAGIAEIATLTEAVTGTDHTKIITPDSLTERLEKPPEIGSGAPNTGAFTSLTLTTDLAILDGGTGASTAADARTNLDVDVAGTDNSTNVTLAGTLDYLSLSGQEITLNAIDLADDVTGLLALTNGGTGDAGVTAANIGHLKATDQDTATTSDVVHNRLQSDTILTVGTSSAGGGVARFQGADSTTAFVEVRVDTDNEAVYRATNSTGSWEWKSDNGIDRFIVSDVGTASWFWILAGGLATFAADLRVQNTSAIITSGSGSPEGVKTATVGSKYSRTDGGANTSNYFKESGTGNTGWVGK